LYKEKLIKKGMLYITREHCGGMEIRRSGSSSLKNSGILNLTVSKMTNSFICVIK